MKVKQAKREGVEWQRFIWIGGALGLYFGLFFRPIREPSLGLAVGLGLAAALATTLLRAWQRKQFAVGAVVKETAVSWAQYTFFLSMLEGRHLAYAWGGKTAVILMTTLMGAISGWWYGYTRRAPTDGRERT